MSLHELLTALVVTTALRVFVPDMLSLTRRLLSAGVRVGAAGLLEDMSRSRTSAPPLAASRDEEG
ncbi:hypothetical protein SUDANB58_05760 (plasmid) [Streptomyces sp. enrichment culture]|uniref:hypothetical protein n=1 Tax=Streptomyces sp. enrichment culture TaxID=1795815 RepID=UPI003F57F277